MKECRKRERNYAKEPIRNSDLRSIVTEIKKKKCIRSPGSTFELAEGRIGKIKERSIESIQSENQE